MQSESVGVGMSVEMWRKGCRVKPGPFSVWEKIKYGCLGLIAQLKSIAGEDAEDAVNAA